MHFCIFAHCLQYFFRNMSASPSLSKFVLQDVIYPAFSLTAAVCVCVGVHIYMYVKKAHVLLLWNISQCYRVAASHYIKI